MKGERPGGENGAVALDGAGERVVDRVVEHLVDEVSELELLPYSRARVS
jgi:hypothetical protein